MRELRMARGRQVGARPWIAAATAACTAVACLVMSARIMRPTILVLAIAVAPTLAAADVSRRDLRAPRTAVPGDLVAALPPDEGAPVFVRQLLPASGALAAAESRIIYLNRTGIVVRPGDNDSRTNRSTIVSSLSSVPAWNTTPEKWAATVACFKDLWKEFDVVITDQDPGNVPHMEAVFGGSPGHVGMPSGVGGVSPFTTDCSVIESSIVFTFTNVFPDNPQIICEVMAQEVAHSYGLDHEMLASDPMTYLTYNGKRTFKDQLVPCGEYQNRPCGIGGSVCRQKQNSVALLRERAGIADRIAPTLEISSPRDRAVVAPAFEVEANADDNVGVTMATLFVDGQPAGTLSGPGPYAFPTDAAVAEGPHAIAVEVTDGRGNVQRQEIGVTVRIGGGGDGDGDGDGEDDDGGMLGTGCAAGGEAGLAVLLALAGLRSRRRRR